MHAHEDILDLYVFNWKGKVPLLFFDWLINICVIVFYQNPEKPFVVRLGNKFSE